MNFTISPEEAGKRIDVCVTARLGEDYSRMYVKNLLDSGMITVNGHAAKPNYKPKEGDRIEADLPPLSPQVSEPEDIPVDIIYEDESLVVVNKPAGMVVHPGAGNKTGTLVNAMLHHCSALADTGDAIRPGIVHRLDKDTSGIIVIAKTDKAMRSLAKQFQNRTVRKTYVALVKGRVELDNGLVDMPLARHSGDRKKMTIEREGGKHARTIYHVVKRYKGFTMVRLDLETGRTHQIRVHMKHIGHPVVGDLVYGGCPGMARQALHAEKLKFTHPVTCEVMEFTAPIPDDMAEVMERGTLGGD